jgi:hypothetical protein
LLLTSRRTDKKAVKLTRDPENKNLPEWLKEFRTRMPEPPLVEEEDEKDENVPDSHRVSPNRPPARAHEDKRDRIFEQKANAAV